MPGYLQPFFAFIATAAFAIIFNVPRKEIFFCGLTGGLGWLIFIIGRDVFNFVSIAAFMGAFLVAVVSRCMANYRKTPATLYLISGIIPFVPGAGIYFTMYYLISNNTAAAAAKGIETIKTAGMIALAIVFVLSLPMFFFNWWHLLKRRSKW